MSDIEKDIQAKGLTAPRITPSDIESNIVSEYYFTAAHGVDGADIDALRSFNSSVPTILEPKDKDPDLINTTLMWPLSLLTFSVLILKNGFIVTGESACASPENFDFEIGKKIARQNAVNKIWPLMGYELKSKLSKV